MAQEQELGFTAGDREGLEQQRMMDRRVRELVLISLLAVFCGGLAWAKRSRLSEGDEAAKVKYV